MLNKLIGILFLFNIIFLSAALDWAKRQYTKNCKCAQNWRLKYMISYFIFSIFISLFSFIALFMKRQWLVVFEKYISPVMTVLPVVSASIILSYFVDLEKKDCDCGKGPQEKFMYYISVAQVIVFGLMFLGGVSSRALTAVYR